MHSMVKTRLLFDWFMIDNSFRGLDGEILSVPPAFVGGHMEILSLDGPLF